MVRSRFMTHINTPRSATPIVSLLYFSRLFFFTTALPLCLYKVSIASPYSFIHWFKFDSIILYPIHSDHCFNTLCSSNGTKNSANQCPQKGSYPLITVLSMSFWAFFLILFSGVSLQMRFAPKAPPRKAPKLEVKT